MSSSETVQRDHEILQKIGAYGVSDQRLMEIAATICSKRPLTEEQKQYVSEFESRLEGRVSTYGPLL